MRYNYNNNINYIYIHIIIIMYTFPSSSPSSLVPECSRLHQLFFLCCWTNAWARCVPCRWRRRCWGQESTSMWYANAVSVFSFCFLFVFSLFSGYFLFSVCFLLFSACFCLFSVCFLPVTPTQAGTWSAQKHNTLSTQPVTAPTWMWLIEHTHLQAVCFLTCWCMRSSWWRGCGECECECACNVSVCVGVFGWEGGWTCEWKMILCMCMYLCMCVCLWEWMVRLILPDTSPWNKDFGFHLYDHMPIVSDVCSVPQLNQALLLYGPGRLLCPVSRHYWGCVVVEWKGRGNQSAW